VVVNHHLLFADMALRDAGFGEILPTAQCVVIDEAHQLPELAANAFGHALSARQLRELSRDSDRAARSEAPDMPDLREAARLLEQGVEQAIGALTQFSGKQSESLLTAHPVLGELLETLHGHLSSLGTQLELAAGRGEELEACERRSAELLLKLRECLQQDDPDAVRWLEAGARGFVLHVTPLSIADRFRARLEHYPAAWVFCSGTLAIGGSVAHFCRELGIVEADEAVWHSPFDYANQALLHLPPIPCDPGDQRYLPLICDIAEAVFAASRGRAFFSLHELPGAGILRRPSARATALADPCARGCAARTPARRVPAAGQCRVVWHRHVLGGGGCAWGGLVLRHYRQAPVCAAR